MKPDKKADDLLREKLNSYSSPVPAGLFDAMDKKREEQQAAGAFGWRVKAGVSVMVLLLMGGLAYWQMNLDETVKSENALTNKLEQIADNTSKHETITQTNSSIQTELAEEQQASNIQIETTKQKTFIDNTQQQTKSSNSSASSSTKVVTATANQSNVIQQTPLTYTPAENTENSLYVKNSDSADKTSAENLVLPSDNVVSEKINEIDIAEQEKARQSVLVSPLANKGLLVDDKYHAAMPKIKCGWEARKVYLYFDAITSIDMAFRTLSPKLPDGESANYAILRNQTEVMQESTSIGFRASAVTRGGFAMRTGLVYSNIKEQFSYIVEEDYNRIIETEVDGQVVSIDTVPDVFPLEHRSANRHRLLDIPVIIGYEIDKDKYNIAFNGGTYINVSATQQGRLLTPTNEIVNFSTDRLNRYEVFKPNVGLSLYSSMAVNYKITPAVHFIFEPYWRYYMNSFTTNNHELNQNYFVAGMQIGLRMKM